MQRGVLRVYLGSAPGVGKTYRCSTRLASSRTRYDVVVAYVETHGRALTEAQLRDLESYRAPPRIPRCDIGKMTSMPSWRATRTCPGR